MLFVTPVPRLSVQLFTAHGTTVETLEKPSTRRRPSGARSQACLEATKTSAQAGHAEGLVISQAPPARSGDGRRLTRAAA